MGRAHFGVYVSCSSLLPGWYTYLLVFEQDIYEITFKKAPLDLELSKLYHGNMGGKPGQYGFAQGLF